MEYHLWNCIQIDFAKFKAKHFDELDSVILIIIKDYSYLHNYWINHNFVLGKTYVTIIIKAINKEVNKK